MIKWCIYLPHLSSGCYEAIRQSGCITLPSQRTLRDYTHFAKATMGFSVDVDLQLIEAAEILDCPEWKKCVMILMDEMYVKENLVYEKSSGKYDKPHIYVYTNNYVCTHTCRQHNWFY